jgi:hypothetical protein
MLHFVYKTISLSGKYYIGRHSTNNINDGYFGSGKWVRSIKDTSSLTRKILLECNSSEELLQAEKYYIALHIDNVDCMNFNRSPVGFSSGDLNPNSSPEAKAKCRQRMLTDNPAKRPEVRKKMSETQKNLPRSPRGAMSIEHKDAISKGRMGISYSKEGREKLSKKRKEKWQGKQPEHLGTQDWKHTEASRKKLSESRLKTPKQQCLVCEKMVSPNLINRWHNENCKSNNKP